MNKECVIVGGGVIGLSAALAMAQCGFNVVVIDKRPLEITDSATVDSPVYAINRASKALFDSLGVWSAIIKQRHCAYQQMKVWDKASRGEIVFDCKEVAQAELGFIMEERIIRNALLEKIHREERISLLPQCTLQSIESVGQSVALTLAGGDTVQGALLLACDGANSWVRQQGGFSLIERSYHHEAIVCTVKMAKPHQQCARQIFTMDGPLAFLPLHEDKLCSIVWSTTPSEAARLTALPDTAFSVELASAFEDQLGAVEHVSPRLRYPLKMRHAKNYVFEQRVLLGDAAHTIHPLAGQGVNLGLQDVAGLLAAVKARPQQFNQSAVLRRFERARKGEVWAAIAAMDALKYVFSPRTPLPLGLKAMGIRLSDSLPPVKRALIERAMG